MRLRARGPAAVQIGTLVALMLVVPLVIHVANARHGADAAAASYLPALEGPRARDPFNPQPIAEHAGAGSAWWYLVLKNWVIASGAHPRCVFVFFRDTNLTNAT